MPSFICVFMELVNYFGEMASLLLFIILINLKVTIVWTGARKEEGQLPDLAQLEKHKPGNLGNLGLHR